MAERIVRERRRGSRLPEGAAYVGRPSRWGNPYPIGGRTEWARDEVVEFFRFYATRRLLDEPGWLVPLRGHDLACWCPLDQPCHADVLLELANA